MDQVRMRPSGDGCSPVWVIAWDSFNTLTWLVGWHLDCINVCASRPQRISSGRSRGREPWKMAGEMETVWCWQRIRFCCSGLKIARIVMCLHDLWFIGVSFKCVMKLWYWTSVWSLPNSSSTMSRSSKTSVISSRDLKIYLTSRYDKVALLINILFIYVYNVWYIYCVSLFSSAQYLYISSCHLVGYNNNNNNKQICIAPLGRNFRGIGARQRVSEQRKERKPGIGSCCLHLWTVKTVLWLISKNKMPS